MNHLIKATTAALIATTFSSFGAGAAPLSAPLALRDAVAPALQTVQWGGGGYYAYDNGYYCPPYYGYYSSGYYGYSARAYYGGYGGYAGYGYQPYYRRYGYAPRFYGSYWRGY